MSRASQPAINQLCSLNMSVNNKFYFPIFYFSLWSWWVSAKICKKNLYRISCKTFPSHIIYPTTHQTRLLINPNPKPKQPNYKLIPSLSLSLSPWNCIWSNGETSSMSQSNKFLQQRYQNSFLSPMKHNTNTYTYTNTNNPCHLGHLLSLCLYLNPHPKSVACQHFLIQPLDFPVWCFSSFSITQLSF